MTEFDPFAMCRILNEEKVDYVVLGGFAAILRGSPITTRDLDVIPDRARENLDRLGCALTRMNAMIRISGDPVPTKIDGPFLANMPQIEPKITWHCRISNHFVTNYAVKVMNTDLAICVG